MATSSITHNFVLKEKDDVERFILAIEASMNDNYSYSEKSLASDEELKAFDDLFAKWENRSEQ